MEYFIVDRIEGDMYILEAEDKKHISVLREKISAEVKESDVLYLTPQGIYKTDQKKTQERKKKLFQLQNNLFK